MLIAIRWHVRFPSSGLGRGRIHSNPGHPARQVDQQALTFPSLRIRSGLTAVSGSLLKCLHVVWTRSGLQGVRTETEADTETARLKFPSRCAAVTPRRRVSLAGRRVAERA